jgi:hypothetical protein
MIEHVIGDDGRYTRLRRRVGMVAQPRRFIGQKQTREGAIGTVAKNRADLSQFACQPVSKTVRQQNRHEAFLPRLDIRPSKITSPLARTRLTYRQQTAKPAIGLAVNRIHQHGSAALKIKAAADDETDAGHLGRFMRANKTRQ